MRDGLDELEALANGELGYDTEDTVEFFASPKVGKSITTPNGSTIKVTSVKSFRYCQSDHDMWLVVEGKVKSAPQCPQYTGQQVTFLVKRDGTVCFADDH